MASITTIRDLAFKISMKVSMANLKKANKAVDEFSNKVTKMQRGVSRNLDIVNRRIGNIKTFKAVRQIDKLTQATNKLKLAAKINGGSGYTGSAKPLDGNQPTTKPSRGKKQEKKLFRPSVQMPYQSMLGRVNVALTIAGGLTMLGIIGSLNKINKINLSMTKSTEKRSALLKKQMLYHSKIRDIVSKIKGLMGENNYKMMGGIRGLSKMLLLSLSLGAAIKLWRAGAKLFNESIAAYSDNINGLVRQEAFFANALKYREQIMKENLHTGAKTYSEFKAASRNSLMEARKNIKEVAKQGIVSTKELNVIVGQLASFQIDTDKWFGGKQGGKNIQALSDLTASIQAKTGSRSEALRVSNMIGKAVTMGQFGQLQR